MAILEVGIIFHNLVLVNSVYIKKRLYLYEKFRENLISSILNLKEDTFLTDIIDYLVKGNYIIAFFEDKILSEDSNEQESLIAYGIIDHKKNIDNYIYKVIIPHLKMVISEFKSTYTVVNLSKLSQLKEFKIKIDEILSDEIKTLDQKFRDSIF